MYVRTVQYNDMVGTMPAELRPIEGIHWQLRVPGHHNT